MVKDGILMVYLVVSKFNHCILITLTLASNILRPIFFDLTHWEELSGNYGTSSLRISIL